MSDEAQKPGDPAEPSRGGVVDLFQIKEDDLAELERTLPDLCSFMYPQMGNRQRVQFRRLKEILSNVRWNYGPPGAVVVIPL